MDSVNGRNQPQIESGTLRCMEKQKHMAEKAAQALCIDFRSSSNAPSVSISGSGLF